ncbi:hypothetical protein [Morganella morganii]|uniref:hypothetical protein n=1 Tax=Morganella morganii TaxID=582 RepID=UPI0023683001|nr:hypothetical protein [Morganella morganii]
MSLVIGKGCFPCIIDTYKVLDVFNNTAPPTLSIWEKIKEFFCRTHQTEAMACLHKLCHPEPPLTKIETKALFERLRELAYPGFEDYFSIDEVDEVDDVNEYNKILNLRITSTEGYNLLTIRIKNNYFVEWKDNIHYLYPLRQSA